MSDGISWYYENKEKEEKYNKHIKSGKFSKEYLEEDILRNLNEKEIEFLCYRFINQTIGFTKFLLNNKVKLDELFERFNNDDKIDFIKRNAKEMNLLIIENEKVKKFYEKLDELNSLMFETLSDNDLQKLKLY